MKRRDKIFSAIIPARGGSKGLPGKNTKLLCGIPLIMYTVEAAIESQCFDNVYVSTDDSATKKICQKAGITIIDRPPELATDDTSSQDVVRHVLNISEKNDGIPEYVMLLQPTSPFRKFYHIQESVSLFLSSESNSCISVCKAPHHPYKALTLSEGFLHSMFNPEMLHRPRQSLPEAFQQNGAIYIVKTGQFLESNSFSIYPTLPYLMTLEDSIDIDTLFDFNVAEYLMKTKISHEMVSGENL